MFLACGVVRFAYNWAYDENLKHYHATGKTLGEFALSRKFNSIRGELYPWTYAVTKWASQIGIRRFSNSLEDFFNQISNFPKRKKRKQDCSFHIGFGNFKVRNKRINLPHGGRVKMAEGLRFPGVPKYVDIKREGTDWFACIAVDVTPPFRYRHLCENQTRSVGIDLGLKDYITLNTGDKTETPKIGRKLEKKLVRAQRAVDRKEKWSANQKKARAKVSKIHKLIARRRKQFTNALSSNLVSEYGFIGIESLNLTGLLKTHWSKSFRDAGFGEFIRQLEYKSKLAGTVVQKIDRFFPSTKTCSSCNLVTGSSRLNIRAWTCTHCGMAHDRDTNAAKNILVEAARKYQEAQNACGDLVKPKRVRSPRYKSKKQELPFNSVNEMR